MPDSRRSRKSPNDRVTSLPGLTTLEGVQFAGHASVLLLDDILDKAVPKWRARRKSA